MNTDICIIGGGASGLSAAISAKESAPSASVVIVERLPRVGKKILATGNGRCNLGNTYISPQHYHGSVSNFMDIIGGSLSAEEFFASLGVICISDESGRLYPYSNTASSVLNALRIKLSHLGITEICGFDVKRIDKQNGGFIISDGENVMSARKVIIAAGGSAAPALGTDGSINKILRKFGHRFTQLYPAAAPLKVSPVSVKRLKGLRVRAKVTAVVDGFKAAEESGEIQFNEGQLSGICVFNLSYLWAKRKCDMKLLADFAPEYSFKDLPGIIGHIKLMRPDSLLEEFLTGMFHKNLAVYLFKSLGIDLNKKAKDLDIKTIKLLVNRIKSAEFPVIGTSAWSSAQVTHGGIHGSNVDNDLQSKRCPGLYFCGEILDIDGICGGYNLAWAWASGIWAGRSAANELGNSQYLLEV